MSNSMDNLQKIKSSLNVEAAQKAVFAGMAALLS